MESNETDKETNLLTRRSLKTQSEQQAGEAKKSVELERKRQKLKEKSLGEEAQHAIDVAKKIQAEGISRMAKHHLPIGLPKSVSLRDDPLTIAQAFLTEMPAIS